MKLLFSTIIEAVTETIPVLESKITAPKMKYVQVLMYRGGGFEDRSSCIYLIREDPGDLGRELLMLPDACLSVIGLGPLPEEILPKVANYVITEKNASEVEIMNAVNRLFVRMLDISDRLYEMFNSGKGIQTILNEALIHFQNPIYVHDRNYCIFGFAENRKENEDWGYDFYSRGRLSAQTIKQMSSDDRFQSTFDTTEPTYYKVDRTLEDFDYLYCNLTINGNYVGRIIVDERFRKLVSADYDLLAIVKHIVELSMHQHMYQMNDDNDEVKSVLKKVIRGEQISENERDHIVRELGWNEEARYLLIRMVVPEDDEYENISIGVADILNAKLEKGKAFLYEKAILAVIRFEEKSVREVIEKKILRLVSDFNLKVGVSLNGSAIKELPLLYRQTMIAFQYGKKPINYYNDHILSYILDQSRTQLPEAQLCSEALLRLIDYDKKNDTDLVHTLQVYLENGESPTRASELLFIHRSTLLYRMERIWQVMDTHLEDSDEKLLCLLNLRMLFGKR